MRGQRPARFLAGLGVLMAALALGFTPDTIQAANREPEAGYRLAGTVAVGSDYLALIAVPEGGQVLARAGSVIKGAKVLSVSATTVRIVLASGVVELSLEGSGSPATSTESLPTGPVKIASQHGQTYERDVAVDELSRELHKPPAPSTAGSSGKTALNLQSAQHIAEVLDLPPGSRIMKVGPTTVTSAEQAIKAIEAGFAYPGAMGLTIEVQTPQGPARVYVRRAN